MRSSTWRWLSTGVATIVVLAFVLSSNRLSGAQVSTGSSPKAGPVRVGAPVTPVVTFIDTRTLTKQPHGANEKAIVIEQLKEGAVVLPPGAIEREKQKKPKHVQRKAGTQIPEGVSPLAGITPSQFLNPNPTFEGIGYTVLVPPDTNGAPGPNHYIQIVNSQFEIFDKQGNSLAGPSNINTLWSAQPTSPCFLNNNGDPVVLYDAMADRWLISQFATPKSNPSHECVAISQTADPTAGVWFLYDFVLPYEDDYPKLGVWPDGYYFSSQEGYNCCGIDVAVFDRANMLNGNPATFQTFHVDPPTVIMLPGDLNGPPPPPGTPNPFARPLDGAIFGGSDRVEIWEFHVDWGDPSESTFTNTANLAADDFSSALCSAGDLDDNCVPQKSTTTVLETQDVWPMGPLEYRNFGDHETLVFNHTVNATPATFPNGQAGVHWYEIRRNAGTWSIFQESTFAPDTTDRWMGSVAMDQAGNMAAGYSVSSSVLFPGINYVGRLAGDPLNEMTTPEVNLATGTGFQQINGTRWGDYSAMRVDPVDGCTFWYTTQYINANAGFSDGSSAWDTHVGAFRFPTCNPADISVTKTGPATITAGNQITYTITVTNNGPATATNVIVTDTLPQVTFLNSSTPCTLAGSTLTCNLGTMAGGASVSFFIQALVPANELSLTGVSTATLKNTVAVTADQSDPNPANNTASVTTTVNQSADLSVAKTCKPDGPATAGSAAFCTMVVSNAGPSDAQGVTLVDTMTSNGSFTVTSVVGPSCTQSGNQVTCNLGTVPAGGNSTVTVNFTSNSSVDVNDTATVSSTTPDPNTSNNSATGHVTFVASANLAVTKVGSPNPVIAGTNLTYTIGVSNVGPSVATNVVVRDTLPAQISVLTAVPSAGSCTAGIPGNPLQPLTCNLGSLTASGPGSTASITVTVLVASNVPDGTIINNNASVSSDVADPNNANNIATAAVTVHANADLAIVKTSDKTIYKPSSVITYTIAVTNQGPSDALAVIVTDNLPVTMQAIYQNDTGGCTKSGLTLTCNLGTMPVGTSKSFIMHELVKGSKGLVSNTASVTSSTVDPSLPNNSFTRTVTIGH